MQLLKITQFLTMRIYISITLLVASYSVYAQNYITDDRDSSKYEIFQIGQHLWFKSNLKFKTPTSWCSENPNSEARIYGHNVLDKPKKLRRFSVRCICDIDSTNKR